MVGTSLATRGVMEVFPGMVLVPTGGRIFYVHNSGPGGLNDFPPGMLSSADGFFTTVQLALRGCRAGRGDRILCLPGHAESIASADAWSNLGSSTGVEVWGMGKGDNRPTFTWTTAGSTLLMDAASFAIRNCRMFLAGAHAAGSALTVAAPITASADGCEITDCSVWAGFDADQIVTIGVTVTGDRFVFERNIARGEAAAVGTTFLRLTGADDCRIVENDIAYGTSAAAVGPIQELTTACTGVLIDRNIVHNRAASSTACITMALASTTGTISRNFCRNMTDASNAQIVVTSGDVQLFENYGVNNSNERGIALGTASA